MRLSERTLAGDRLTPLRPYPVVDTSEIVGEVIGDTLTLFMTWPPSPLVVSALSGALAALLLRGILKLFGKLWMSRRAVAEYDCAADSVDVAVIGLWHGFGEAVSDDNATNGFAWSHTAKRLRNVVHTIYGPYVNDIGRPGYLKVRFRIAGAGFENDSRGVILLDVNQILQETPPKHTTLAHTVVRAKQLRRQYRNFDVICYTSGVGEFEYRARVLDGQFEEKRNRILFDSIQVYRHMPWWEIF